MKPKSIKKRASRLPTGGSANLRKNDVGTSDPELDIMATTDVDALIQNLEIHRAELETQNEELRRVHAELSEIRDRYRDLYEFAPVGYLTLDAQWRILDANLAARQLAGNIPIGERIETIFLKANRDDCYLLLKQRGPGHRSCELRLARKDGMELYVNVEVSHILQEEGQPVGYRMTLTDITPLKSAEHGLRQANADLEHKVQERTSELARRASQLRALANELTVTEQRERRKIASILHDHLQQMLVAGKFLIAGVKNKKTHSVRVALLAVDALLDQAIDASRTLTVQISPPILEDADVAVCLDWLSRWMSEKQGLTVDVSVEPNLPPVTHEIKFLIFEFVRELLFNTIKHAKVVSARVEVQQVEGRELLITMSDQGVGFDPEPFRSGHIGKGFGLFSIQERLDFIGGKMTVESAPGKGTRLTIRMPLDRAPKKEQALLTKHRKPAEPGSKSEFQGRCIRVLIADDHTVVREGLVRLLEQEPDIEIIGEAVNGEEVVQKARQLLPDIILMDMNMPKLNGLDATRIIHSEIPGIAIIGLSMFEEVDRARAMLDAGAVQYVPKSGRSSNLISVIRKVIKPPNPH